MKKLCTLLALIMLMTCVPMTGCTAEPEPNPATDFEYTIRSDGDIIITKYIGKTDTVIIPSKIDGRIVKIIGGGAFNDVELTEDSAINKSIVTSVFIPDSITVIGEMAFSGCDKLIEVRMSNQIITIGRNAFSGCRALASIDLSIPTLTEIHDHAFQGCFALTTVNLPKSLQSIGKYAFERNIALVELTMEEGITSIGISAFAGCKALQKVTIPASVQTIGDLAFSWCTALKEVVFLGNAPDNIGNSIFDEKTVTIYYDPATSGWDTTKMKEKYTLIPIG